jgi:hypothetical protein
MRSTRMAPGQRRPAAQRHGLRNQGGHTPRNSWRPLNPRCTPTVRRPASLRRADGPCKRTLDQGGTLMGTPVRLASDLRSQQLSLAGRKRYAGSAQYSTACSRDALPLMRSCSLHFGIVLSRVRICLTKVRSDEQDEASSVGWKPDRQADARSHHGASLLAGCGSGPTGLSAPPTSCSPMPFAFTTDPGMSHETYRLWRRASY